MHAPFTEWPGAIAQAADERGLRELLTRIGRWRLDRLSDLHAQREALWALSEIYRKLGEAPAAEARAEEALRLCGVPPVAPREVGRFVERHLERLRRSGRAPERDDRWAGALTAAHEGRFGEARAAVGRAKGPRAALFRVWTRLAEALAADGEAREEGLRALERELAGRFAPGASDEEAEGEGAEAPVSEPAPPRAPKAAREPRPARPDVEGTPLSELLGRPVPGDRDALVDAMDAWLSEHPDAADALAAAALRHHVSVEGREAVAPWLAAFTGRALALGGGEATRAALAELEGAWALTLYAEAPFGWAVELVRAAVADGWVFGGLRRGLGRGGRAEGATWTLRLSKDGVQGLVALVPDGVVEGPRVAEKVAQRTASLASPAVVVAPGTPDLAPACRAAGLTCLDAPEASAVLAALLAGPRAPLSGAAKAASSTRAPERRRSDKAAADKEAPADRPEDGPVLDAIREGFEAAVALAEAEWTSVLSGLTRSWRAFLPLRDRLEKAAAVEIDARLAPFLRALHAVTPEGVRLAEAATWAVRVAAGAPEGEVAALLSSDEPAGRRFGGPRIAGLAAVAGALGQAGWTVRRVLDGVTRREARAEPGLAALAERVTGLWRLVVQHGDRRGEVWWIDAPSAEARAALPLLLLPQRPRVIVVPADGGVELPAGVAAIAWSGAEAEQVVAAAEAFEVGGEDLLA